MRSPRLMVAVVVAAAVPAMAQVPPAPSRAEQEEMLRTMQLAAHNQLGVLQYCQSQGSVGADTIALQRRLLTMIPPAQVSGLDAAEAAGRRGVVQFAGSEVSLVEAARAQRTTADAMCKQIASMLEAQSAQLPK